MCTGGLLEPSAQKFPVAGFSSSSPPAEWGALHRKALQAGWLLAAPDLPLIGRTGYNSGRR